eukprot:5558252-Amphidinium_carterae.6
MLGPRVYQVGRVCRKCEGFEGGEVDAAVDVKSASWSPCGVAGFLRTRLHANKANVLAVLNANQEVVLCRVVSVNERGVVKMRWLVTVALIQKCSKGRDWLSGGVGEISVESGKQVVVSAQVTWTRKVEQGEMKVVLDRPPDSLRSWPGLDRSPPRGEGECV